MARDSLEIKRKIVQRLMDDGLFPYTKRYLGILRNHFSTIGVNGLNEMIRNFTHGADDITSPSGRALALYLLPQPALAAGRRRYVAVAGNPGVAENAARFTRRRCLQRW